MSDAKYISVIHIPTQQTVSAFQFENDATWIGKDREGIIATPLYCEKFDDIVKMSFLKSYKRKDNTAVNAHFKRRQGEKRLTTNLSGESDSHRNAKESIYNGIYSGQITIDGKPLDKTAVKNMTMEHRTSSKGYIIPDVLIEFKDPHPKYGLGIFFEIQFSKQKQSKTNDRSYERVIRGFSGTWLNIHNFDSDKKFIGNNIDIESHKELLIKLETSAQNDFIKRINNYGEIIDNKLIAFESMLDDIYNNYSKKIKSNSTEAKNNIIKIIEYEKSNAYNALSTYKNTLEISVRENNDSIKQTYDNAISEIIDTSNLKTNNIKDEQEKLNELITIANSFNIDYFKKNTDRIIDDGVQILSEASNIDSFKESVNNVLETIKLEFQIHRNNIYNEVAQFDIKPIVDKILLSVKKQSERCPSCGKELVIGRDCHNNLNIECKGSPYCEFFIKNGGEKI